MIWVGIFAWLLYFFDRQTSMVSCIEPVHIPMFTIACEHIVWPGKAKPEWLFSFRGTDLSHPIRRKLFRYFSTHPRAKMVRNRTQFHSHSVKEKQDYVDDILSSKFVLCPRGWSPSTYRLFEVMELGRCPVIISDDWVPIHGVPWQDCCISN